MIAAVKNVIIITLKPFVFDWALYGGTKVVFLPMPKQDKKVVRFRPTFASQQAGNPL